MDSEVTLSEKEINYFPNSVGDVDGSVFTYNDRIFRVIWNQTLAEVYNELLQSPLADELFENGLIKTTVNKNIKIQGAALILEHEKISFHTVPGELTDKMFWEACKTIINVFQILSKNGYSLKDAHPWNILFKNGKAIFIDFTSIVKREANLKIWFQEFYQYCSVPIYLASSRRFKKFAWDFRKENGIGFGTMLIKSALFKKVFFLINQSPSFQNADAFLNDLIKWINKKKPYNKDEGDWTNYDQGEEDAIINPKTIKESFVFEILKDVKPKTVLDTAANKGFFSEMAALLGASVAAFDYEQYCVNACQSRAEIRNLDITPILMDFKHPIPASDIGLCIPDSLTRFKSDIVIAVGLIHHLCLSQNFPVKLFCKLCLQYSKCGIIMEYIYPEDFYVSQWHVNIPKDYSLESFLNYFSIEYPNYKKSAIITDNGIKRIFIYCYK